MKKVRYAVVGLGHITQVAALPAFKHAKNSELALLVSGDKIKRKTLGRRYRVPAVDYPDLETWIKQESVDAVYIGLPNSMHAEYTIRAAKVGAHVLCEKPLAVTVEDCRRMIQACESHRVKLMTAYRLHFEPGNMATAEIAASGKLGRLRHFQSTFAMQVKPGNIRLSEELGGGALYDLGVYCINAARYLFRSEPEEVLAVSASAGDKRFKEVEEMWSVTLRFPDECLASFTCSFGSSDVSAYRITGTKGSAWMEPAYEYAAPLKMQTTIDGKKKTRDFVWKDQFAPEFVYFSDCILNNREPQPSGKDGMADVAVVEAIQESARKKAPVKLLQTFHVRKPNATLVKIRSRVQKPELVGVEAASQ